MVDDKKALKVGRRILAAFDAGRDQVNRQRRERAEELRAAVRRLAEDDRARGRPAWGGRHVLLVN